MPSRFRGVVGVEKSDGRQPSGRSIQNSKSIWLFFSVRRMVKDEIIEIHISLTIEFEFIFPYLKFMVVVSDMRQDIYC
jgi:hypothetical protein